MKYNYCPTCGTKLILKNIEEEGNVPYCKICERLHFPSSKLCVLVAVMSEDNEIALTKQKHIVKDAWILISGFIKEGEEVETAGIREVREEIGLEVTKCNYIKSYYIEQVDMLMLGFAAYVIKEPFRLSKEIDEIKWFSYEDARTNIMTESVAEQLLIDIKKYGSLQF